MDISKILVDFNGSDISKKAFNKTVGLAKKHNASITALCVISDNIKASTSASGTAGVEGAKKRFQILQGYLEEIGAQNDVQVNVVIIQGNPIESVMRYAKEPAMDLIVVGAQGISGGFKQMMTESPAQKIVGLSSIPVLVIK